MREKKRLTFLLMCIELFSFSKGRIRRIQYFVHFNPKFVLNLEPLHPRHQQNVKKQKSGSFLFHHLVWDRRLISFIQPTFIALLTFQVFNSTNNDNNPAVNLLGISPVPACWRLWSDGHHGRRGYIPSVRCVINLSWATADKHTSS